MASSGTYNFSMDIDEVIQEASEMIGGEQTLGNEPKSARRSINLLLQDWQNRGVMLWSIGTSTVSLTTSVTAYAFSSATVDVLEAVHNRDGQDIQLQRISMEEYMKIPNKGQTGRTTQYAIRNGRDFATMHLWPIPENSTDTIKTETFTYLQDVNKSAIETADVSRKFLPCLTAGLAYNMAIKRPGVDMSRITMLKTEYEERMIRAMEQDRERTNLLLKPRIMV
jgi:hypothetical protein